MFLSRRPLIDLGFASTLPEADGRSLAPLLRGEMIDDWRSLALVEHRGPVRNITDPDLPGPRGGNPTTYEAIRTLTSLYVEYANGEKEFHDLTTDRHELRNSFSSLSNEDKASLHAALEAAQNCRGTSTCKVAEHINRPANPR